MVIFYEHNLWWWFNQQTWWFNWIYIYIYIELHTLYFSGFTYFFQTCGRFVGLPKLPWAAGIRITWRPRGWWLVLRLGIKAPIFTHIGIEHGPVEIVDLPMKSMVIFHRFLLNYQRVSSTSSLLVCLPEGISPFDRHEYHDIPIKGHNVFMCSRFNHKYIPVKVPKIHSQLVSFPSYINTI